MATGLRLVQVGLGAWGRSWAQVVSAADGCELTGVVDALAPARAWATGELGLSAERVHASLEVALEADDCDGVLVVSPPGTHRAVVTQALAAGKHVLVEKPLATTLEDARALVAAAAAADRVLVVSQNYRYRAPAQAVRRVVAEGGLGSLVAVHVVCRRDTRAVFEPGDFRFAMKHPYVLDMAIHHFDLVRALTGQDVRNVVARGWRVPDSPYVHHAAMAGLLTLTDGTQVHYEGDWATRSPETSWNAHWELLGDGGRLSWTGPPEDLLAGQVWLRRGDGAVEAVAQPAPEHADRAGTLESLRRAVGGGTPPDTAAEDNLKSLGIVLGCVESIETGAVVGL